MVFALINKYNTKQRLVLHYFMADWLIPPTHQQTKMINNFKYHINQPK